MNPHFFTAPFYFAFIWFRVQGSEGSKGSKGSKGVVRRISSS